MFHAAVLATDAAATTAIRIEKDHEIELPHSYNCFTL